MIYCVTYQTHPMIRIPSSHPGGPGLSPGMGNLFYWYYNNNYLNTHMPDQCFDFTQQFITFNQSIDQNS